MSLEFTLKKDDEPILQAFNQAIHSNVPIKDKTVKGNLCAKKLVINCTKMCKDLIKLGCTPRKSLTIEFPAENLVPLIFIPDFIRGYFDGDGGVFFGSV